jgi:hypothetical protein
MSGHRSHVDALLAADIESQMSPDLTVYERVHDWARAAAIVKREGLRTTGNPPGTNTEETATAMMEKTSIFASTNCKERWNNKSVIKRVTVLALMRLACGGHWGEK